MPARLRKTVAQEREAENRFDPTVAASTVNVADYGFEGRFEDRSQDAHYNESDRDAHLIPVQDAGPQTHLRSLDIRFGDRG
jgi:hypothetical protein